MLLLCFIIDLFSKKTVNCLFNFRLIFLGFTKKDNKRENTWE